MRPMRAVCSVTVAPVRARIALSRSGKYSRTLRRPMAVSTGWRGDAWTSSSVGVSGVHGSVAPARCASATVCGLGAAHDDDVALAALDLLRQLREQPLG